MVSVFGPNGCGKSTLIGIMAGIIAGDDGAVSYGGELWCSASASVMSFRTTATRFSLGCVPSTTSVIRSNLQGLRRSERDRRVDELSRYFDVGFDLKLYPHQLSGGHSNWYRSCGPWW